ncbi:hypothetical protein WH297_21920 [Ochrobactrum vermis]|uniref:Uncharacterized protein n=1 Tax=Ochrobactrum vermis TaxID=1827297 RepID=A0ABU8PJD3_9HYPH
MHVADLQTERMRRLHDTCRYNNIALQLQIIDLQRISFRRTRPILRNALRIRHSFPHFLRSFERRVSHRCSKLIFMHFQQREEKQENNFP